jgi:hypothetical protein
LKKFKNIATILLIFRSEYYYPKITNLIMKKLLLLCAVILLAVTCKKVSQEPFGPTDIRISNVTDINMYNVTVNTYDSTFNYGTINAHSISDYHRFDRAYPTKANISAIVNGLKYKTDTVASYAYLQYLGQIKATFEIFIVSDAQKKLAISNVIQESGLK